MLPAGSLSGLLRLFAAAQSTFLPRMQRTRPDRQRGLLDGLQSAVRQDRHLLVAPDRTFTSGLRFGSPLQGASPLHSPLYYPGLPVRFTRDDPHTATQLSRRMLTIAKTHSYYRWPSFRDQSGTTVPIMPEPAFYPAFCGYSPQVRVTFHHGFCARAIRWEGLVGRLCIHDIAAMVLTAYPLPLTGALRRPSPSDCPCKGRPSFVPP